MAYIYMIIMDIYIESFDLMICYTRVSMAGLRAVSFTAPQKISLYPTGAIIPKNHEDSTGLLHKD
jgi:hypothetical protein